MRAWRATACELSWATYGLSRLNLSTLDDVTKQTSANLFVVSKYDGAGLSKVNFNRP